MDKLSEDPIVVVFGANGMLGQALMREAHRRRLRHHLHGRETDITDAASVSEALEPLGRPGAWSTPTVVINAAAFTHVDACETDREKAFAANAWGPRVLADVIARKYPWCAFVQVSTGAVFDGRVFGSARGMFSHPGYDEFEPAAPISAYAKSKWAGEQLVREVFTRALIVRVGHLYGRGGKNALSTTRARILAGERFTINDHCRIGPTYAADAARAILDAGLRVSGTTLHVAPSNATTAFSFALRAATPLGPFAQAIVGRDTLRYPWGADGPGEKVLGVSGPVLAKDLAWRPDFQLIRSSVLERHGVAPIGTWEEGLDRYLKDEASS